MSAPKVLIVSLLLPLAAHAQDEDRALSPDAANAQLSELAAAARSEAATMDFETFRDSVLYLPQTGKYYVNGDVPIRDEKQLREFWEDNIRDNPLAIPPQPEAGEIPEFIISRNGGLDQVWSPADRMHLTYCISTAFGGRHPLVVAAMNNATTAWEASAALDFIYLPAEDGNCTSDNDRVVFDVVPVQTFGRIYAAAFFPNDPRPTRSLVIDNSAFAFDPNGALTLDGILRHELGHVIGARHEHLRPEAGTCFRDEAWRAVTDYDALSVMHYPYCNGQGDWSLRLTARDQNGAACIYGAARGFTIDRSICDPGGTQTAVAELHELGPFDIALDEVLMPIDLPVAPGTPFSAMMTGEGDPDLYVKFDDQALPTNYDCRPYLQGAEEECSFPVPEGRSRVSIAVHGYLPGRFSLTVTATPPAD